MAFKKTELCLSTDKGEIKVLSLGINSIHHKKFQDMVNRYQQEKREQM